MRIFHPQPEVGRQSKFDVEFVDGVAAVESLHPERELAFRQHGYRIEADAEVEAPYQGELGDEIVDLTSLTVKELRDIAETEGVDLPPKARKPEIVKILSELPAEPIPGATQNEDGTWTIEGQAVPEGVELEGPFGTATLTDGTVVGDGTSLVTLPAVDEASEFED
ncbi:hypothetical protein ABS642_00780 [Microbacterium sp. A8/3-1]|uniref:Rho termination factor-like N-terminal domain-containing protein n=1 Tax=Microbacterium sp. A8/3-1 TaxID=3160749 RepID=A0AAU7VWT7_9MICO